MSRPYLRRTAALIPWAALSLLAAPRRAAAGLPTVRPFFGTYSGGLVDGIINIINALLLIAAIAAVAYIIISGVRYFASQGDERAVEEAKRSLIFGVIGILVTLLALVIVNFFSVNLIG